MADLRTRARSGSEGGSDVYTGLLGISLVAMIIGCTLLFLDYSSYSAKKPEPLPQAGGIRAPGK
jgi:hypothetical protein